MRFFTLIYHRLYKFYSVPLKYVQPPVEKRERPYRDLP